MTKTYIYFSNPFMVIGMKSFKKAVKLSKKTYNELLARQADPFYGAQLIIYKPYHMALIQTYDNWKAQGGMQKGATLTFKQHLKLMPKKMDGFIGMVVSTSIPDFEKGSPNYVSLLPHGRNDFQAGKATETRMDALAAFSTALGLFPAMAPIKALFDPYLLILQTAESNQSSNIGTTGSDSDDVKAKTKAAMEALYAVMGSGIAKFKEDATVLENIFAMQILRNHRQVKFTGQLNPGETHNIMEHSFDDFDELVLSAKDAKMNYYLALNPFDGPAGYTLITVDANTSITVEASQFTKTATNRFLCAVNADTALGRFTVKLI